MKIKRLLALLMVLVLACGICACGDEGGETAGDEKVKVTLWHQVGADASEITRKLFTERSERMHAEFPQYEIEEVLMQVGANYRQEYDKNLMAGLAPTMFDQFSYTDIPARIENGTVANITDLVNDWDLRKEGKVFAAFDDAISKNGEWYAIPMKAYTQATMVNKKKLIEGGGSVDNLPDTWEEFAEVGAMVTDFDVPRIGYSLLGSDWCAWVYTPWVWSAGGDMVRQKENGKYTITFQEDPGVDAAMYLNRLIWEEKMVQKNVLQSVADMNADILSGRAVFSWAQPSIFTAEELAKYDLTMDDFCMIPIPSKDESIAPVALTGGEVITFNPKSSKEEIQAAWDVATFLYYDEDELTAQWQSAADSGGMDVFIPARSDLLDKKLEIMGSLPEQLANDMETLMNASIAEPYCPNWTEVKSALVNPLQKIYLTEGITREEAKALLTECAETLYQQYPDSFEK